MYIRKTRDIFELMGNYGCGWEYITEEETQTEARRRLAEYRENAPGYPYKIVKKREAIR